MSVPSEAVRTRRSLRSLTRKRQTTFTVKSTCCRDLGEGRNARVSARRERLTAARRIHRPGIRLIRDPHGSFRFAPRDLTGGGDVGRHRLRNLGRSSLLPQLDTPNNRQPRDLHQRVSLNEWVPVEGLPFHRPVREEWIVDLQLQCKKARVAFFFKQWGGIRSKAGGRELRGREWSEMPTPKARTLLALA